MKTPPRALSAPVTFCMLVFVAALSGCGGGDDSGVTPGAIPVAAVAPVVPVPTAPASTTVSGAVVKGPVSGAQVCAYSVVANARGAALGNCTTADATGLYSLAVPADRGALWLEATGGSYVDEVGQATVSLPAGSPLLSLVAASGSTVTAMLTPLTTLALNAARTATGAGGTLDAAAFASAAAQLMNSFALPAGLDITTTLPTFGAAINPYGSALTAISQMVANGSTLASILATTQPGQLQAAYAVAAIAAAGPAAPPPANAGTPTASGTLTVAGATGAGAATSVTPQADGFTVDVDSSGTTYTFARRPNSLSAGETVVVTVPAAAASEVKVSYSDLATRSFLVCSRQCGVTIGTPAGASHPVTVTLAGTPLTGGVTLTGSLVGDAPGALWSPQELPRTTTGPLTVGGVRLGVLSASDETLSSGSFSQRTLTLRLSDGAILGLGQTGTDPLAVQLFVPPASIATCLSQCGVTLTSTSTGSRVTFANTPLTGGVAIDGTVDIGKTSGSLTSSDSGGFTPVTSAVISSNAVRKFSFSVLGTDAQAGLSLITVSVRNGKAISAQATVGIATQVLACFETASFLAPACAGISLAADGRSLSFANTTLRGGPLGQPARDVVFNGRLVAKGE